MRRLPLGQERRGEEDGAERAPHHAGVSASPPALCGDHALRAGHADGAHAKVSVALEA